MSGLLTFVTLLGGVAMVGLGLRNHLRARFHLLDPALGRNRRRRARLMTAIGSVLVMFPWIPTSLFVDSDASGWGAVASLIGRFGWATLAFIPLTIVWLTIGLTSLRPLRPEPGRTTVVGEVVNRVTPNGPYAESRRLRRDPAFSPLPAEWDAVVALDEALTDRLLTYQRDVDAASALPGMADLSIPETAAAWEAMRRCDDLRTATAPAGTRDAVTTAYGKAVAQYAVAVTTAEERAHQAITSGFVEDEHAIVSDAEQLLAFVRSSYTTPTERAEAYAKLARQLEEASAKVASDKANNPRRSHPWLDVEDRIC